jgi:hypothetical protein
VKFLPAAGQASVFLQTRFGLLRFGFLPVVSVALVLIPGDAQLHLLRLARPGLDSAVEADSPLFVRLDGLWLRCPREIFLHRFFPPVGYAVGTRRFQAEFLARVQCAIGVCSRSFSPPSQSAPKISLFDWFWQCLCFLFDDFVAIGLVLEPPDQKFETFYSCRIFVMGSQLRTPGVW